MRAQPAGVDFRNQIGYSVIVIGPLPASVSEVGSRPHRPVEDSRVHPVRRELRELRSAFRPESATVAPVFSAY